MFSSRPCDIDFSEAKAFPGQVPLPGHILSTLKYLLEEEYKLNYDVNYQWYKDSQTFKAELFKLLHMFYSGWLSCVSTGI